MQGRPKGGKNNYYSKEEKIKIVKEMLDCNFSPLDIEKKYNTTVSAIKDLNNLVSNNLSIGQILKIPSNNNSITYIVKSGDNLYSIARKYNTTVNSIKLKNNLSNNLLSIGQKLII